MKQPNNIKIERTFRDIPDDKISEEDQTDFLADLGYHRGSTWDDLLCSSRILIISEAGAGKTYECRELRKQLWEAGEPAFYLELATLAQSSSVHDMLDHDETIRFDAWLASQSDVATFFLDSIDELKLTLGSFEVALKRLAKALQGQLRRVRIVITSRPIPIDEQLFRDILPIPPAPEDIGTSQEFANIAMGKAKKAEEKSTAKEWRNVALMPLSDDQIREMAEKFGVPDVDGLLAAIRQHNAQEFARRPQDLIELCADWRDHRRIRTHREQVASNIAIKLKPRAEGKEKTALSHDKALEGASRLALAALLTRKLTLRHSAEADREGNAAESPLDPAGILPDWSDDERKTLLERALFGFASYGRVRFHHRSVIEYLAAHRLLSLRDRGMPLKAVKRLLFATTAQGHEVVRPSLNPVAAWMALHDSTIFDEVLLREPSILLNFGDPESLTLNQRQSALRAYVERYGGGGWRGLHVPAVQVHRFASPDLSTTIAALWDSGIENSEVRELLIDLIGAGKVEECADIPFSRVSDPAVSENERIDALQALIELDDPRLEAITADIAENSSRWSSRLTRHAIIRLFPTHLTPERLCRTLARTTESRRSVGDISWHLPRVIEQSNLSDETLEALRRGLTELISDGLEWKENAWPHLVTKRRFLTAALGATCLQQLKRGSRAPATLRSVSLALRSNDREYDTSETCNLLRDYFRQTTADIRKAALLAEASFLQELNPQTDPLDRYIRVAHDGALNLVGEDLTWVLELIADRNLSEADRALMLEVAVRIRPEQVEWLDHLNALKPHVADSPALVARLDEHAKPRPPNPELERMEREHAKYREDGRRRDAKAHASWVMFWQEIAENPDALFADDRADNTAWNLWRVMDRTGDNSRASGWNRRFIERHFGKEVADQLRLAVMAAWRNDRPSLRSERPEDEKGKYLIRWQLGIAGIAAEAEDPQWAEKLTPDEASLAARYAPLEMNGYPIWLEALAKAHPQSVESVLGGELAAELAEPPAQYSMILQNIRYAPLSVARIFVPRLQAWLDSRAWDTGAAEDRAAHADRLRQTIDILLAQHDDEINEYVRKLAGAELTRGATDPLAYVWLPVLFRLDPATASDILIATLEPLPVERFGPATSWFSSLFGDRHSNHHAPLSHPGFTPRVLLKLARLAYTHLRIEDDMKREGGVYTPNDRDNAERARSNLLNAIIDAEGPEGWAVKLEMAEDPLFAHFKDRLMTLARERAAEEADAAAFAESDVVMLDQHNELPPLTRDDMFTLMVDRLDDLEESLLRDDSPRAAWELIKDEKIMRQQIAREMRASARNAYTVDQEAVTADEKETDIRLRSTGSDQEAVIELKIGEKPRSAADLRATIKDQLVTKYMAANNCRAGCLLITIATPRTWQHPDTDASLDLAGLIAMLNEEAKRIEEEMGGSLRLMARGLDLQPRLPTERAKPRRRGRNAPSWPEPDEQSQGE